jgi:hypothetical protein
VACGRKEEAGRDFSMGVNGRVRVKMWHAFQKKKKRCGMRDDGGPWMVGILGDFLCVIISGPYNIKLLSRRLIKREIVQVSHSRVVKTNPMVLK